MRRAILVRLARAAATGLLASTLSVVLTGCFSAPPQIISLEPNRGSTGVAADAPVRVIFDKPVVHATVVGRFTVSPPIPGCDLTAAFSAPSAAACWIHWLDPQPGFELLHTGAVFAPQTQYIFTLAGGFADAEGDRNGLDHHWDITSSPAPRLTATTPGDRSTDVPVDAPLAVSFSAPMDAPSTAAAITLDPPVPDTRVVRNLADHNRFVILPGRLLVPGVLYTITVDHSARGEDGQAIAAATAVRFTTAPRLAGSHMVVLAGTPGGNATEVLLPALTPAVAGEPVAAPVLERAPVCTASAGCGVVGAQAPLANYEAAAVAPDGRHVALVVDDVVSASSALEVIDTLSGRVVARVQDGVRPSWSPDGSQLALVTGSKVEVLQVAPRKLTVVDDGVGLTAPPLWSGRTTLVLSTAASAAGPGGIELVDLAVGARYSLPRSPAGAIAVAVSPAGTRLALSVPGGAGLVVPAAGATGAGQQLPPRLQTLGFADEGTVVAIGADGATLLRVNVNGGDTSVITLSAGLATLPSVIVAPDGRTLAYLAVDTLGVEQAFAANADGSGGVACTRFIPGAGFEALAVDFGD